MSRQPPVRRLRAGDAAFAEAGALIRAGHLVAFPTETVYGLGADATQGRAVAAIFAAKGRPRFNPLIVHVADAEAAAALADMGETARRLAGAFWPGPLTLVLRRRDGCGLSELVTAGLETVAVRVPDHPVAQAVLRAAGCPVAAPSANRSGHVSATTAAHVAADFEGTADRAAVASSVEENAHGTRLALILDGGPTAHGIESTVLDVTGEAIVLLRPGAVTVAQIEAVSGQTVKRLSEGPARPSSPGLLASHYAPRAMVRLDASGAGADEALLGFGPDMPAHDGPAFNLSASGDLMEAAAHLFAALRWLDETGVASIAVMPIPEVGLGEAIRDRLGRAAAGREKPSA